TAVGGILADRIGTSATFVSGAVLVLAAGMVALKVLLVEPARDGTPAPRSEGGMFTALRNLRFIVLLLGIAIPMNVLMAAFLWYTVPLALDQLGARPADIGRALMVYYLLTIFVTPWTASVADRWPATPGLAGLGGLLSGLGLLALSQWYGF